MDNPVKLNWVIAVRERVDRLIDPIPLPNISPNIVSVASVVAMAMIFIWRDSIWWVFSFILLSILLDWFDGLIARRHNRVSARGYIVDSVCDRASELLLVLAFFQTSFLLIYAFVLNIVLAFVSWKTKLNLLIPLRLLFLLFILYIQIYGIKF